jgi:hypothetical protein
LFNGKPQATVPRLANDAYGLPLNDHMIVSYYRRMMH